jgi:hypothetical protein
MEKEKLDPSIFYSRSKELSDQLRNRLLGLSTGLIAGLFYVALEHKDDFTHCTKTYFIISIISFGLSLLSGIMSISWDSSRFYFLGEMNNPNAVHDEKHAKTRKRRYDKISLWAKFVNLIFFAIGIIMAVIILIKII